MSLNNREITATGDELRRHAAATGLDVEALSAWLGVEPVRIEAVLAMKVSDPVLTWLVRDALDDEARRQGVEAGGWSVLTDAARHRALSWYRLVDLPPRHL